MGMGMMSPTKTSRNSAMGGGRTQAPTAVKGKSRQGGNRTVKATATSPMEKSASMPLRDLSTVKAAQGRPLVPAMAGPVGNGPASNPSPTLRPKARKPPSDPTMMDMRRSLAGIGRF